jgi:hypothetical protein
MKLMPEPKLPHAPGLGKLSPAQQQRMEKLYEQQGKLANKEKDAAEGQLAEKYGQKVDKLQKAFDNAWAKGDFKAAHKAHAELKSAAADHARLVETKVAQNNLFHHVLRVDLKPADKAKAIELQEAVNAAWENDDPQAAQAAHQKMVELATRINSDYCSNLNGDLPYASDGRQTPGVQE